MRLARSDVRHVLTRVLDEPNLVAEVRALAPAQLAELIEEVGLEDAGEIVALATTEQLERVFDTDLWAQPGAGADEEFDEARFVVWLEILLEAGHDAAARRLAELDADTLTHAFHRLAIVVNVDELANDVDDDIEKALEGVTSHEVGPFMVIARRAEGWDALLTALVALDEVDHGACERLLERLTAMTEGEGDLYDVLTAEETLADDVAGARNDRRAEAGFIAPADARAFLRLAREHDATDAVDPITKAYFRELKPEAPVPRSRLLPKRKKRALPAKPTALALEIGELPPALMATRLEELAYLVNVLIAGDKQHWRPAEAAEAVVSVVTHGLELLRRSVADVSVVVAFRAGVRAGKLDSLRRDRR